MSSSESVQCPACGLTVPLATINAHLDASCSASSASSASASTTWATTATTTAPVLPQQQPQQQQKHQPNLHRYFGGTDSTIPDHFVLTRNLATGALEASFTRAGMQMMPKVAWTAAVHLRGLAKSVVLATDIPLDELADQVGELALGGSTNDDDEFDGEDEEDEDDDDSSGSPMPDDALMDHDGVFIAVEHDGGSSSSSSVPVPVATAPPSSSTAPQPQQQQRPVTNLPYLKSHLQKCVRRRLVDQAVGTAHAMLGNPTLYTELVRRLPIIAVEDARVFAHAFPVLVWLMMAASKGYSPAPAAIIPDLLGAVAQIAAADVQDLEWNSASTGGAANIDVKVVLKMIEVAQDMPRWARDTLWAVQCRREFGGMAGDMRMLDQTLLILYHRFKRSPRAELVKHFCAPVPILPASALPPPLSRSQFLLNAIDYHVSPVVQHLHQRFPQFSEDLIKRSMWECSSGVNRRLAARGWDADRSSRGEDGGWEWAAPKVYTPAPELVSVWRVVEGEFIRAATLLLAARG
ncbi:hypothetical protein BC828DRAFT_377136 [Blastocladiella britannica]|nr:hypothetical protein BC828DRAFT_377136 [Blastocladiella britannica]